MEKGEYSTDECRKLDCKFEQEGRFGLGCALVEMKAHDGSWIERGEKCPLFDYSGRTLLSIKDFETKKRQEFNRVRNLSSKSAAWISNPRDPNALYESDRLIVLIKVGKKKE